MRVLMVTPRIPDLSTPDPPTRVATMAPVARQIRSLRTVGVEVDVVQIEGLPRLRYAQSYPRVLARSRAADVVHGHYGYCGWLARGQLGRPVVVSFMGTDVLGVPRRGGGLKPSSRVVAQADRWLARHVDATIVKSPEMAEAVAPAPALVIPNGVDLTEFTPIPSADARRELGLDPAARYVLFGGNPSNPRKGHPLACAAVERAAELLGEPVELLVLRGVAAARVPLYMSAAEALLMTSLLEGSPNVVKEALACELPVVSVPVGDVPSLLEGVDGCVLAPREAEALAAGLVSVLRSGRRCEGRQALRRKGLDDESVARRVAGLYEEIAGNHRGGTAWQRFS
jgi:glycosyltransferase involved in cell wall biosynthesis